MSRSSESVEIDHEVDGGDVKGWNYRGPIDEKGKWSPRGGYEMIVHSHISEDDDERESWVAPTDEEHDEFRRLMETAGDLDIAGAEFASRVLDSIVQVQRQNKDS